MEHTSIDELLSFAVITDPAGNIDFLRRAVLELPYREIERTKESKKPRIQDIEAIFVIGRLVDPLFRPNEAEDVALARRYLQDELDHNRDSYSQINITDVPGLAHHLKHNASFKRWHEQSRLIPAIEKFIGLKNKNVWLNFGEAKDRIVEQYHQMEDIAEESRIPVYFAADTMFLEQVIPEERWLHWKSLLLGTPQEQLIKTVGMTGIDFAIPEYLADPTLRGTARYSLAGFEPFQGKVTITYGMPDELLKKLKESNHRIVIAGKPGLFDKEANPAEHYPGNLLFLERPQGVSFYSFGNEAGVRVVYFLHNNKIMFFPESMINLREMSASAGKPPKESDAEAAAQMSDMAADMVRFLSILENQSPKLAQKIRKAGLDRPQQLVHLIEFYANQVKEKEDIVMRFASFVDEIIRHAKLSDWCQDRKKEIYESHGVAANRPASHAVEMKVYDFLIDTAKDALGRRETNTEQAFNRCLASIEEIVDCLGLRGWYNEQKENLLQKNGASDSPASPERVIELYPLAITKIKEELGRRKKERDELSADANSKQQYEKENAELRVTITERDKRLDELLDETAKLQGTLAERNKTISEQTQAITGLDKEKRELRDKVADRDNTIKLQTQRLDELGDLYDKLDERLARQIEDNRGLQREKAELEAQLRDYITLKAQLTELEKLAKQLKAQYPNITAEDLKGIFDAYKAGAENALSDSQQALEALQKTLRSHERQLNAPIIPDKELQDGIRAAREEIQKRYDKMTAQVRADAQKFVADITKKYEAAKTKYETQLAEKDKKLAEKDKKIAGLEDALKQNASKPAEPAVAPAADAKPASSIREIAEQAYALVEQGKYEEGIKEYTRAINMTPEQDPLMPKVLANRGRALFKTGQYLLAYCDFAHVLDISPTYKNINQLVTTAKECMEKQKRELSGGQPDGKEAKTITP